MVAVCSRRVRRLAVILVVAVGCGPAVGIGDASGGGTGEGDESASTSAPASTSVNADASSSGGELDAATELWRISLPPLSSCPRIAALDDGGIAIVGNERFVAEVSIPHVVVIGGDGSVRSSFQGGHAEHDIATDVVAVPGGFVVVGQASGEPGTGSFGWMQRWGTDGAVDTESLFGADELGQRISDVEVRDATTFWIVARDDDTGDALMFRGLADAPTSTLPLDAEAFDVQIVRGPDEGVYVTTNADLGTLSRASSTGDLAWTLPYGVQGDATPFTHAVASTASGDAIVTGTDQGAPDVQWIRRFDIEGVERWRVDIAVGPVPSDDQPLYVAVDATDGIYVAGWSRMEGGNDGFLAKYDGDGVELWQSSWGAEGELNVMPCDVAVTSNGGVVVAGTEFLAGDESGVYWLRAFTP